MVNYFLKKLENIMLLVLCDMKIKIILLIRIELTHSKNKIYLI